MSVEQITKEQARVCLENYLMQKAKEKAMELEIEEQMPDGAAIYKRENKSNQGCFYVNVSKPGYVGDGRIIIISKKSGEIIGDGYWGE